MCTELLPPGGYPIAVKYIISYHIKIIVFTMLTTVDVTNVPTNQLTAWYRVVLETN
jgi:hypothetical protein